MTPHKYKSYWRDKFSDLLELEIDRDILLMFGLVFYIIGVPVIVGGLIETIYPSNSTLPLINGIIAGTVTIWFTLISLLIYIDYDEWRTQKKYHNS